jgi:putative thioredoxin
MKGTNSSEVMMNFEIADFRNDVIERSLDTPALVDFWADWSEPCKVFGPIRERL